MLLYPVVTFPANQKLVYVTLTSDFECNGLNLFAVVQYVEVHVNVKNQLSMTNNLRDILINDLEPKG